jgi:hypothetical protein
MQALADRALAQMAEHARQEAQDGPMPRRRARGLLARLRAAWRGE